MTADRPAPHVINTQPSVSIRDLTVQFPRRTRPVLNNVSLDLHPGEHVLVLGPSGSGKSTLLDAIAGLVPHSVNGSVFGEVTVCGRPTVDDTVVGLSRHVARMRQDPSSGICLPSVEQELALPLENRAANPTTIAGKVGAALRSVGCLHLRCQQTAYLSGGESQRVALAAGLVADPDVLLLDEPTSMLDARGISSFHRALRSTERPGGPTVIMVEHRLDELAGRGGGSRLPRRALVLDASGSVQADGRTAEVLTSRARTLVKAGCWLPLEAELYALSETKGGLASVHNRRLLRSLAEGGPSSEDHRQPGHKVLTAQGLVVAHRGGSRTRRSRAQLAEPSPVLTGVNLTLHAGEIVALLGANGSGKSSLLLTMAGLIRPAAGRIEGQRPGLVFQNAEHQFVAHTVVDEIGYRIPKDRRPVIARQLQRLRLKHRGTQRPFRLSGGQKRRLSLAAMLAHDRAALLLDEPTLGLDRRDTVDTMCMLRETAAEGHGVLFASHDLRSVATLADRVVILAEGMVIADGPTWQVLRDQATMRRARLDLPPILQWLGDNSRSAHAATSVLTGLDDVLGRPPMLAAAGTVR